MLMIDILVINLAMSLYWIMKLVASTLESILACHNNKKQKWALLGRIPSSLVYQFK